MVLQWNHHIIWSSETIIKLFNTILLENIQKIMQLIWNNILSALWIPVTKASNVENVSMSWYYHESIMTSHHDSFHISYATKHRMFSRPPTWPITSGGCLQRGSLWVHYFGMGQFCIFWTADAMVQNDTIMVNLNNISSAIQDSDIWFMLFKIIGRHCEKHNSMA